LLTVTNGVHGSSSDDFKARTNDILQELSKLLEDAADNRDYPQVKVAKEEDDGIPNDVAQEDKASKKCGNLDGDAKCSAAYLGGKCGNPSVAERCERACFKCCTDFNPTTCANLKRLKLCFSKKWKDRMRNLCPKTCGYCGGKMPAPPPCVSSKYGCCWDKKTFASGPIGSGTENCPACRDLNSKEFCSRFQSDCYEMNLVKGKQMRNFCPKTCKLCGVGAVCRDHPRVKYMCPQYKAEGLCETNSQTMSFYCEKTCEFCKCYDNPAVNCAYLKKAQACENKDNMARMKVLCPATCGFCTATKKTK